MAELDLQKEAARQVIDAELVASWSGLSHAIHDHPETAFEENRAARVDGRAPGRRRVRGDHGHRRHAHRVQRRDRLRPTGAGRLRRVRRPARVGHACGHNIIAASAVGAGLGLAALADELGLTVRVLGTPAEEGGGGKITMLERRRVRRRPRGDDGPPVAGRPAARRTCLAVSHFDVTFTGKSAHASAAPWEGINAGDAMVVAQVAIGLLRQQLPAR